MCSFFSQTHSKGLLTRVQKAEHDGHNVQDKLCKTIAKISEVNVTEFINATIALTDMNFVISDIQSFFNKFTKCLSFEKANGVSAINNINTLMYQLNTYVIPGFNAINNSAPVLAAVFGADNAVVVNRIFTSVNQTMNSTLSTLMSIQSGFQAAIAQGVTIDRSNIQNYYSVKDFERLILNMEDLIKQIRILLKVVDGFAASADIVDSIVDVVEKSSNSLSRPFRKALRDFDLTITSVKTQHDSLTEKSIGQMVRRAAEMNVLLGGSFFDNVNISNAKIQFNQAVSTISLALFQASDSFYSALYDFETNIKSNATVAMSNSSSLLANVTSFLAVQSGLKGTTAVKCLGEGTHGENLVKSFVDEFMTETRQCLESQQDVATSTHSKLIFKKQDVELNFLGAADAICGCVGTGDADAIVMTQTCIATVRYQFFSTSIRSVNSNNLILIA